MSKSVLVAMILALAGCPSAKAPSALVRVEDLDKPPQAIVHPDPDYTELWTRSRIQTAATVSVIIEEDGRVSNATLDMSTKPEYGTAVVEAAKKFRFAPLTSHGRPARVRLPVYFDGDAKLKFK